MHFETNHIKTEFIDAINDYYFLLNKKYPQKAIIKLIGDRYKLSGVERTMLYRGVFSLDDCTHRKAKICDILKQQKITIDTFNVLITIGSYLNGNVLFIGNDGILRDAAEIHGKIYRTDLLKCSFNLLFQYLNQFGILQADFYIDKPVSFSGQLRLILEEELQKHHISGCAKLYKSPDFYLKNVTEGIIASSDSVVINKAKTMVFDLAYHVLTHHFQPKFVIIDNLIKT